MQLNTTYTRGRSRTDAELQAARRHRKGGTTSPLTGLKTGRVERGQEISRFLDMLRSSLLDFWMEPW
ncbi:hypothetical protein EYF80_017581 [Liparis tanakae]|uniref:Uncharacterized protein n=1 Tax=Liparis tanakae TaxID=230148 RepID=A0A4Z2I4J0_9TELE|nr:hypothetical protein EYF80_017581 [Liparis tanakae]